MTYLLDETTNEINLEQLEIATLVKLIGYRGFDNEEDFIYTIDQIGQELFEIELEQDVQDLENYNEVRDLQRIDIAQSLVIESDNSFDDVVTNDELLEKRIYNALSKLISITEIQLFDYPCIENDEQNYSVNIAINDYFLIQFDSKGGVSIPTSDQAKWGDEQAQDFFACDCRCGKKLLQVLEVQYSRDWFVENGANVM